MAKLDCLITHNASAPSTLVAYHSGLLTRTKAEYQARTDKDFSDFLALPEVSTDGTIITVNPSVDTVYEGYDLSNPGNNQRMRITYGSTHVAFRDCMIYETLIPIGSGNFMLSRCFVDGLGNNSFSGGGILQFNNDGGRTLVHDCLFTKQRSDTVKIKVGGSEVIGNIFDPPLPQDGDHADILTIENTDGVPVKVYGNVFIADYREGLIQTSPIDFLNSTVWLTAGVADIRGNLHLLNDETGNNNDGVEYRGSEGSAGALVVDDRTTLTEANRHTRNATNIEIQNVTNATTGAVLSAADYGPDATVSDGNNPSITPSEIATLTQFGA